MTRLLYMLAATSSGSSSSSALEIPEEIKDPSGAVTADSLFRFLKEHLPAILTALAIIVVGYIVMKVALSFFEKVLQRSKLQPSFHRFFVSAIKLVFWLLILFTAGGSLGIDLSSCLAVFSVAGLAISLAVKDSLTDVAGGLQILFAKPFAVGDFVELDGISGTVQEIGIVYTKLSTIDNRGIYLPNSQVSSSKIINCSSETMRMLDLRIPIRYDDDYQLAKDLLHQIVYADEKAYKDPAPLIRVGEYGDTSLNILLRVWAAPDDLYPLKYDLLEHIKTAFDSAGLHLGKGQLQIALDDSAGTVKKRLAP